MSRDVLIQRAKAALPMKVFLDREAPDWRRKNPIRADDENNSFSASDQAWKDHGSGKNGDQITFLTERDGIPFKEAKELFLKIAGVSNEGRGFVQRAPKIDPKPLIDWAGCVNALTDQRAQELAQWRAYPLEFVQWLKAQKLIGIYADQFALPVHNEAGQVVGIHHKHPDGKWRCVGAMAPLVIGNRQGKKWLVLESQWDAFSVMEGLCYHLEGYEAPFSVLVTRGADNGKFSSIIPEGGEAIVIMQNDEPKKDGSIPSEKWLSTIQKECAAELRIARPPRDLKDCNDWLRRGDSDFNKMLSHTKTGNPFDRILEERAFNILNPPEKPYPVLSIAGKCIATAGNLVAITGQAKSGKTAIESAMIASLMNPIGDCLGVVGGNPDGLAVLHFDNEQSRADHHAIILQALSRAGLSQPPAWLHSFCLSDVDTVERRKLLSHAMAKYAKDGRLQAVFLDGIGDLCLSPNDEAEALNLVAELHRLAITYHCPIICILHENPGENSTGKSRGHLDSQLERKAEANLRIAKENEISTAFTEKSRHCSIPKEQGPRFQWCDRAEMHVSVISSREEKMSEADFEMQAITDEIFSGCAAIRYSDLKKAVMSIKHVGEKGAEKVIREKLVGRFIRKNGMGSYEKAR